ncbi:MAG: hypothetical protein FWC00_05420 [Firmicutes bacterium]|nr:hypothetical protein [Bacillota bacterium]
MCIAFMVMAFVDVTAFLDNGRRAILLVGTSVIPVLFPFFFIGGLLTELQRDLNVNRRVNIFMVVVLGLLSGFPTGAKLLSNMHKNGTITRTTAIRISPFITTASPIFTIAVIGVALFKSPMLGVIIYVAHIGAAFITGAICFRLSKVIKPLQNQNTATPTLQNNEAKKTDIGESISNALHGAVSSVLAVAGLVIVFFIGSASLVPAIAGIFEMTTGIFRISEVTTGLPLAIMTVAILSFGGLCIAAQGFVFTRAFALPAWFYFAYKTLHTILAIVLIVPLYLLFL